MDEQYNTVLKNGEPNSNNLVDRPSGKSSESCGWFGYSPAVIQKFASPRWLLFVICIFVFVQNIVTNGFVNVSITTLERQFDLSSSQAALISGGYDIGAGLGVVPVSYYFADRHKGKALTAGLILYGIGSLMFASPHFFASKYSYHGVNESKTICSLFDEPKDVCTDDNEVEGSISKYLYVFVCAQVIMGLAATPIYTIGVAYLDENVKYNAIGAYIGVILMMAILSAAIGFVVGGLILNNIYVNFISEKSPVDTQSEDWMGAWWLGFVISAIISFFASIPMSFFPEYLPGYEEKSREKTEAVQGNRDEVMLITRTNIGQWKNLPSEAWDLIKNFTFLFLTLGSCSQSIIILGIVVFLPKFLEVMYLLSPGTAASLTGLFGTIFGAMSTLIAGWAIRKWKMDSATMLKMSIAATISATTLTFAFFLKCPEPPLVGVSVSYNTRFGSNVELTAQCNEQCLCSDTTYNAVCGSDGRVFFDACYAGCTEYNEQLKTYFNCSCILSEDQSDQPGSAIDGACATKTCTQAYIFLALLCVIVTAMFVPGPAIDTITLRCVPHRQRSLALAVQWLIIRCLATIPGPFLIGSLFDVSCNLWNRTCDGSLGRCHSYDRAHLGVLFVISTVGFGVLSVLLYSSAYFSNKRKEKRTSELVEVPMTTDTSQL